MEEGILESGLTQQAANSSWVACDYVTKMYLTESFGEKGIGGQYCFYYNTIAKDNNISIPASRLDEILW